MQHAAALGFLWTVATAATSVQSFLLPATVTTRTHGFVVVSYKSPPVCSTSTKQGGHPPILASSLLSSKDGLTVNSETDVHTTKQKEEDQSVTNAVTQTFLGTLSKLGMDIPLLDGNQTDTAGTTDGSSNNSDFFDKETMATEAIAQALAQIRNVTGVSEEEALEMMDDDLREQILSVVDDAYVSFTQELREIRESQVTELEDKINAIQKESEEGLNKQEKRLNNMYTKLKKSVDGWKEEHDEMESALKGDDDPQSDNPSPDALQRLLKQDGYILNALLAGTILFSLRSLMETVYYMESHSSHHMNLAMLQGGLALGFLSSMLYLFGNDILKAYGKSSPQPT